VTLIKRQPYVRAGTNAPILPVVTALLAVAIFIMDSLSDLEIAVEVLYVAIVLMSVSFCQRRGIIIVSAGCVALTVLSYFLSHTESPATGLINDGLSLVAIVATTCLVLRIKSSEAAMQAARAQVAHVARLTTLGELTVSIAHEVNQPLAAIVTNGNAAVRWLAHKSPNLQEARQALERIVNNGNRASNIIERVRDLAKRSRIHKEWLNINKPIQEIIGLTSTEIQQNRILLRTQLSDDLPLVRGDAIQLQQVLLNLILNAIEAMSSAPEGSRELLISSAETESGDVLVTVRDSGAGVEASALGRLFDAFYTTKPNGLGMGLAISRSIVEAHEGQIWVIPHAPQGASIQFTLPIVRQSDEHYLAVKVKERHLGDVS
jgi:C4-dicarboxylate-specific signal transduction histidine kinase